MTLKWSGFDLELSKDYSNGEGTITWGNLVHVSEDGKDHYATKKALGWADDFWPRVVDLDGEKFSAMGARCDSAEEIQEMVFLSVSSHCLTIMRESSPGEQD